jgi:hypothetical protein
MNTTQIISGMKGMLSSAFHRREMLFIVEFDATSGRMPPIELAK